MLNIQIVSDLHIEKYTDNDINGLDFITPSAPILILCGDIGSLYKFKQLFNFFNSIVSHFSLIIYVPGNNEYYYHDSSHVIQFENLNFKLKTLGNSFRNLKILNKSYFIYNNYLFCGCVLWSYIHYELPQFVKIHGMNKDIYNKKNFIEKKFIQYIIQFSKQNNLIPIIITHYPPTKLLLTNSKLKFYYKRLYYNNMDYMFHNKLTWIYGHTHSNICKKIDNTYFFTNQKGSHNKSIRFVKNFTLKI